MRNQRQISKWLGGTLNFLFYPCLLAVILIVLRIFAISSFKIPSDSMSPAIQPGDVILVDKCTKGARLFDLRAALDDRPVDIHRMPGWRNYKRDDILVFNFPYREQRWDSIVLDVMKYYVKRCVGLPGDTLEIRNGYYRISGIQGNVGYLMAQKQIAELPDSGTAVVMPSFPWSKKLKWTIKEFGPLPIPEKGQSVQMDSTSWLFYRQLVGWEQRQRLHINENGCVYLGDSLIHEYRFRENYYFVAGDNAYNSQDSRYWGLLPESFIVGRAVRIWKSTDATGGMRWNRILKKIE